jgi:hypothetical protein
MAVRFIGGGKPEFPEKTTDLLHVTDSAYVYFIILLGAFVLGGAYVWEAFVLDPKIRMISDPDINQETREVVESIFNHQYIIYTQK